MPSARDENQRSEPLRDILGLTSSNSLGSVVDSVQTFRNLAQELTLSEITETEKKVKQIREQLDALQETLTRLRKLRVRFNQVSGGSPSETKQKSFSKVSAANVIPFPLLARGGEANPISEPSAAAKHPVAGVHDKSEGHHKSSLESSHSPLTKPDPQKLHERPSSTRSERLPEETDEGKKETFIPSGEKAVTGVDEHSERKPEVRVHAETSAQESPFRPTQPEPAIPELVIPNEQPTGQERPQLPSKHLAVDEEIRELVKTYGEVDIYSHREGGEKQNLLKAALAGILLIAVLLISYLFLR